SPFEPRLTERKARRLWSNENARRQKQGGPDAALVEWFGLHEARHSFSTYMDHSGVTEARGNRYMGHSARGVEDRYRHLLAGQMAEDAKRVDEYLAGAVAGKIVDLKRLAAG